MSRRSVMTPRARKMAFKREMLAEIARLQQMAARLLAEFDGPAMGAVPGVVLEGHIAGNEIIVDGTPAPARRTRTT
jgi:hypothetical protein